jgi:hypothetical protein
MITNAQLAKAFRDAVPFLWKGDGAINYSNKQTEFICNAISFGEGDFAFLDKYKIRTPSGAARKVIHSRLDGNPIAEMWLDENGVEDSGHRSNKKKLQQWRHQWLQMLIKEFENKS